MWPTPPAGAGRPRRPGCPDGTTAVAAAAGGLLFSGPLLMIVFRRKYPRWWFGWNLERQRFTSRAGSCLALMDDRYPCAGGHQPVHLDYRYPGAARDLNRWLPLVRWLPAIPHCVVLFVLGIAAFVVAAVAWFAIVVTGTCPLGMSGFAEGVIRWNIRVVAYAFTLVSGRYPPFRLAR